MFKKALSSGKEQKERNFFQEELEFSTTPELLGKPVTETLTEL